MVQRGVLLLLGSVHVRRLGVVEVGWDVGVIKGALEMASKGQRPCDPNRPNSVQPAHPEWIDLARVANADIPSEKNWYQGTSHWYYDTSHWYTK